MLRIGLLISGGGRTATNLAAAIAREAIPATIAVVVAHRDDVPGVARCRAAGLEVLVTDQRSPIPEQIDRAFVANGVTLVALCGYLRKFRLAPLWTGRTINIHPALLPAFGGRGMYGDRVHEAVLAAGVTESGCTVHAVDDEYDRGPILLQRRCSVLPGDTASALAARVFAEECVALPEVVHRIARGVIPLPIAIASA